MNAPHRAKNQNTNLKCELAGTYIQSGNISLNLREDGTLCSIEALDASFIIDV